MAQRVFPELPCIRCISASTPISYFTQPRRDQRGRPDPTLAAGNDEHATERFCRTLSVTIADFLRYYAEADAVAVPMRANIYSGITVALEAAALGGSRLG